MENKKVNAEILSVLMTLGDKYINKIPHSVVEYLIQNSNMEDMPSIDKNKRIEEQNISKDARVFLTMLKLKYWCKSEEEKEILLKLLNENEEKQKQKMQEKYNSDNLFKNENRKKNNA